MFTNEELTSLGWEKKGIHDEWHHPELPDARFINSTGRLYFYSVPSLKVLKAITPEPRPVTLDTPYGPVGISMTIDGAYVLKGVRADEPTNGYRRDYGGHDFIEPLIDPKFRPFVRAIAAANPKNFHEVTKAARDFVWETERTIYVPLVGAVTVKPGSLSIPSQTITNQSAWDALSRFYNSRPHTTVAEGVALCEEFSRKAKVTCCD